MALTIITIYLQVFFLLSFTFYFIYSLVIVPFSYKISFKVNTMLSDIVNDYMIMLAILTAFLFINYTYINVYHPLITSMLVFLIYSICVLLSWFIAKAAASWLTSKVLPVKFSKSNLAYAVAYIVFFTAGLIICFNYIYAFISTQTL